MDFRVRHFTLHYPWRPKINSFWWFRHSEQVVVLLIHTDTGESLWLYTVYCIHVWSLSRNAAGGLLWMQYSASTFCLEIIHPTELCSQVWLWLTFTRINNSCQHIVSPNWLKASKQCWFIYLSSNVLLKWQGCMFNKDLTIGWACSLYMQIYQILDWL